MLVGLQRAATPGSLPRVALRTVPFTRKQSYYISPSFHDMFLQQQLSRRMCRVAEAMGQSEEWARSKGQQLRQLLPGVQIEKLDTATLLQLITSIPALVQQLVSLRATLPHADLGRAFSRNPLLILHLDTAYAQQQVDVLRCVLPSKAVTQLLQRAPYLLAVDIAQLLSDLTIIFLDSDPAKLLTITPELALPSSLTRQLDVLKAMLPPGDCVDRLLQQEPLLLVVDVQELVNHIQAALPDRDGVAVLMEWPQLARWDMRDIIRMLNR